MAKYYIMDHLYDRHLFLTVLESGKSMIKVSANMVLMKSCVFLSVPSYSGEVQFYKVSAPF